jgi:hypothetical protein
MAPVRRIRQQVLQVTLQKNRRGGGVCLRQTLLRVLPASSQKRQRGGMFSSAMKNAWVRLHLRSYSTFYAKKCYKVVWYLPVQPIPPDLKVGPAWEFPSGWNIPVRILPFGFFHATVPALSVGQDQMQNKLTVLHRSGLTPMVSKFML